MNRGANRQTVFFCDADRIEFGRLLGEIHDRFGVRCIAYCLMDNHYHLVLHCPDGNLSLAIQHLAGVYTQHTNEHHGRDGALFRGRFRSIPITTDAYLLCAVRYVHRNCLDLPGTTDPTAYRWSSHRTYLGYRRRPEWLDVDVMLDRFADRASFDAFVHDSNGLATDAAPTVADIRSLIELSISEFDDSEHDDGQQWLNRTLVTLLQARGTILDEMASTMLGTATLDQKARRSARYRARRRLTTHPEVGAMLEFVEAMLVSTAVAA